MWFCNQYMKVNNNQEWVDCVNICFILVVIDMLELCHFSNTFSCWLLMHSIISIYTILNNFTIPKLKDETTFINSHINFFYESLEQLKTWIYIQMIQIVTEFANIVGPARQNFIRSGISASWAGPIVRLTKKSVGK